MGLAVYNSIMLDIRFPACCYKKLLSPAVVPYNNPKMPVGVAQLTLQDLQLVHPVKLMFNNPIFFLVLIFFKFDEEQLPF